MYHNIFLFSLDFLTEHVCQQLVLVSVWMQSQTFTHIDIPVNARSTLPRHSLSINQSQHVYIAPYYASESEVLVDNIHLTAISHKQWPMRLWSIEPYKNWPMNLCLPGIFSCNLLGWWNNGGSSLNMGLNLTAVFLGRHFLFTSSDIFDVSFSNKTERLA